MPKKILIVDDDPIIVDYIVSLLSNNGYDTCIANNGKDAFDVLKAENPDLITLDLEMPEEWGPRFVRKMSKEKKYESIPIIVISGLSSRHLSVKNAVAALPKPFDPDKLLGIVKKNIG